ncbi:MAG: hypothetical protein JW822_01160 [Spirochaetales bacterium]|nr:hypothetical protein [Spirochaetales bacterium]
MKKYLFVLFIVFFFLHITPLAAQQNDDMESAYIKNFLILKIYSHFLGYKVVYWTSRMDTASIYIPMKWFAGVERKAVLVYGRDASYPYLSVIWINNKISHIKIYAYEDTNHYTWGVLPDSPDLESRFNDETIELTF